MRRDRFIKLLKEKRTEKHLSQEQLSKECGFNSNIIVHIESGAQRIYLDQAIRIASVLDFSMDEFRSLETHNRYTKEFEKQTDEVKEIIKRSMESI